MIRTSIFLILLLLMIRVHSQETRVYTDPQRRFWHAKDLFQQGRYSLAYPILRDLQIALREADYASQRLSTDELNFYAIVCALKQTEPLAEEQAKGFIALERNDALQKKMAFHLGTYYFYAGDFRNASIYFEQTDPEQLSQEEIAAMKFQQGYSYFVLGQMDRAKPLLNEVRQVPGDPNFADANYYYGFIVYGERRNSEALDAFRKVENHPDYGQAVPFYIASIQYQQGKKDEALKYAEAKLGDGRALYDKEFQQLAGHAYFEKRQFAKALPLLEAGLKGQEKLTREQLYELSYCYYDARQYRKAADGFRLLSEGTDSLTQSAMYLLGDAYLKMGDKPNARTAFAYCASNSSIPQQKEVSLFLYGKLSYELGYQDLALAELKKFIAQYPGSVYATEARELMISLLANTNNYREALDLLNGLARPTEMSKALFPKVAYGRALELVNEEKLEESVRLLDKVLTDPNGRPVLSQSTFWRGEIAYRQNKLDEAARYLHAYLESAPVNVGEISPQHARYTLGYAYMRKENYKLAQGYFEQVAPSIRVSSPSLEQDAYLRNADCHFMMRDFTKANAMYARAQEFSWPSADYASYQQAMIAGISKPSEKIRQLSSFERKYPSSELVPLVHMEIANSYLSEEKYREAIPYLRQVINAPANSGNLKPRAYLRMGIAQYNLNNNREALEAYQKLVSSFPDAPETDEALESAKAIYVEEGKTGEYAAFLRSAGRQVSKSQEDSLAWSVAESRYASADLNGALNATGEYLKRFPDGSFSNDALFMRSEIYQGKKDWKNAVEGYQQIADAGNSRFVEKASHQAGRINYFELKNYPAAEKYFLLSKSVTGDREQRLDAMRGLLRSQYQQGKWTEASANADELLREKSISTDDKVLASMVRGRAAQSAAKYADAIQFFRSVIPLNNAAYAAEARYEIASCYLRLNDLKNAEKAAFETINKSGSYDFWITRAYILLGDLFWKQKDYFNAKATLQSVVENSAITELKEEAQVKLELVTEEEKKNSNIIDGK